MTHLFSLPNEIIELILQDANLTFNDVVNFGNTNSRYFYLVNNNNGIWKSKFKQRWPRLVGLDLYNQDDVNWKKECELRLSIGVETMEVVRKMPTNCSNYEELCNLHFEPFENILTSNDHKLAINYMMDELMNCIHDNDRKTNLTDKYYSEKSLRYLRQMQQKIKLKEYESRPPEEQLLEHVAVIVAQWSQPTLEVTDQVIGSQLDVIADQVLVAIEAKYGPQHPALCVPSEVRATWRSRNISDNYYSRSICPEVIQVISNVLFTDLGFHGNNEMYYDPENSYINKVLETKQGIPITLCILYESIARRLGIKCEPISFPGHFLLCWQASYKEYNSSQPFYLDVFNGGLFIPRNGCPKLSSSSRCPMNQFTHQNTALPLQVMERMANNLELAARQRTMMNGRSTRLRSALELLHAICPDNVNSLLKLSSFYMKNHLNVLSLTQALYRIMESDMDVRDLGQVSNIANLLGFYSDLNGDPIGTLYKLPEPKKVSLRDSSPEAMEMKFAVGMIMHHKRYNYSCVIFGWDPVCAATEEWKASMNVASLSRKDNQPFYHVLVDDGTIRYAAEENLDVESSPEKRWIDHCQVGRYFDSFCDYYYQMNQEMLRLFPQDPLKIEEYFKEK